jgi:transmembrane sensor
MTEPRIDKYVEAARREVRVRAWTPQKYHAAFRELMRRRGERSAGFGAAWLAAAGFAVAFIIAIVALRTGQTSADHQSSPALNGLQRIALGEGTEVSFERGAELDVRERSEQRIIVGLRAGAARFNVRHDAKRLFLVRAAGVEVVDNGTTFEVENNNGVVAVSVSEGSVAVSFQPADGGPRKNVALKAGQRGAYPAHSPTALPSATQAPAAQPSSVTPTPAPSDDASASSPQPAVDWRAFARSGNYRRAYELIAPSAFREVRDEAGDLLLASDAARLSHHATEAVGLLRRLLARHPRDPRAPSAAFTLGWLLMNELGRPRDAALAFAQAESLAPRGNLAEDASARAVEGWYRAGDLARARAELERYRGRYPQGRHLATLQRLAGVP